MRRLLLPALAFLLLFLFFVAAGAPAGLWDTRLRAVSQGSLGLLEARGSMWAGDAYLAVLDRQRGRMYPVTRMAWNFVPTRLLSGRVEWRFSVSAGTPFTLAASVGGFEGQGINLQLPARFVMSRIPHAIGNVGWHGDISLAVPALRCSWRGICDGSAQFTWLAAAADIFPGRTLGNYFGQAQARQGNVEFSINTQGGEARIEAGGSVSARGALQLNGTVEGDPLFIGRLPNLAGRWVQQDSPDGSRYRFSVTTAGLPAGNP